MAEWSIAAVLKTVDLTVRGFESLSLRSAESVLVKELSQSFLIIGSETETDSLNFIALLIFDCGPIGKNCYL